MFVKKFTFLQQFLPSVIFWLLSLLLLLPPPPPYSPSLLSLLYHFYFLQPLPLPDLVLLKTIPLDITVFALIPLPPPLSYLISYARICI